jgi:hypothetical protein
MIEPATEERLGDAGGGLELGLRDLGAGGHSGVAEEAARGALDRGAGAPRELDPELVAELF